VYEVLLLPGQKIYVGASRGCRRSERNSEHKLKQVAVTQTNHFTKSSSLTFVFSSQLSLNALLLPFLERVNILLVRFKISWCRCVCERWTKRRSHYRLNLPKTCMSTFCFEIWTEKRTSSDSAMRNWDHVTTVLSAIQFGPTNATMAKRRVAYVVSMDLIKVCIWCTQCVRIRLTWHPPLLSLEIVA
jgi:hypothetical protein